MKTIKKLIFLFVFFVFASCLYTGVGVYAKDAEETSLCMKERKFTAKTIAIILKDARTLTIIDLQV